MIFTTSFLQEDSQAKESSLKSTNWVVEKQTESKGGNTKWSVLLKYEILVNWWFLYLLFQDKKNMLKYNSLILPIVHELEVSVGIILYLGWIRTWWFLKWYAPK